MAKLPTIPVTTSYRAERDAKDDSIIRHSVIFTWQTLPNEPARPKMFPLLIDGKVHYYDLVED